MTARRDEETAMSTDEYVPSDEQVRDEWLSAMTTEDPDNYWDAITDEEARARWSRWLASHDARVRRDAAREALDGLAGHARRLAREGMLGPGTAKVQSGAAIIAEDYRDTHYPEETP